MLTIAGGVILGVVGIFALAYGAEILLRWLETWL